MSHRWFMSPKAVLTSFLVLGLMLIAGCGGTAAEPRIIEKEVIREVEVVKLHYVEGDKFAKLRFDVARIIWRLFPPWDD